MTNDSGSTATSARSTGGDGSTTPETTPRPRAAAESSGSAQVDPLPGQRATPGQPADDRPTGDDSDRADDEAADPPSPAAGPVAGGPDGTDGPADAGGLAGTGGLAALALLWLAAMLWVAHRAISADVGVVALAAAARSLPPVVSAGLLAGAAAGLFAAGLPIIRGAAGTGRPWARFAVTVTAGLATGAAAGAAFIAGSGSDPARMAIAGTLAAGATVGGAVAGARYARVVRGTVAAMLAMFAAGVLLGLVRDPLTEFYGAGSTPASQQSASGWFAATVAVISGLAAGLTAYRVLGGARRNPGLRWPAYLVAGAGPGALLLASELIIRTGGAKLFGLVRGISELDRTVQDLAEGSRVNNALVVLFVGAIASIVGLGRTLGSPAAADAAEAGDADHEPGQR